MSAEVVDLEAARARRETERARRAAFMGRLRAIRFDLVAVLVLIAGAAALLAAGPRQ